MRTNDKKILHFIRNNSRMNLTKMSRRTGIPVSTIFDRLRSYEGKLVQKFTCLLDFRELGYSIWAKVFLKVQPEERAQLRSYLSTHPCVNNLYRVNNGFDFTLDCVFHDIKESEDFMDVLETEFAILTREVFHVIDTITQEKLLAEEIE